MESNSTKVPDAGARSWADLLTQGVIGFRCRDVKTIRFCNCHCACYLCLMLKFSGNGTARRTSVRAAKRTSLLHDKQSERDHRQLRIDKVGVRGLRFPIQIRDKAHSLQNTVATIGLFVDLPKEFKGTHMSRFIEVLNAHGNVVHVENITDILYAMQRRLNAASSHLEMEFPFFLEKRAPVSGMSSVMNYTARFDATAIGQEIDFVLTVKANVTTLCPCSKAVTERAYENPVFVEDLVRNIAQALNAHPDVTWYKAEAENHESIHNHNAYACIEKG